jgi:hypothetical protein
VTVPLLFVSLFHFSIPGEPCTYWTSTGNHIVVDFHCRCGRRFVIHESLTTIPTKLKEDAHGEN